MTAKPRSKPKQLRIDSNTGVNPTHTHGLGIWGNERVVMSIRVDKGLKKRFTEASKAIFGSTCLPVETFMASIVGTYQQAQVSGVYPSHTTIEIGEIKIERNLRPRRDLSITQVNADSSITKCEYANCEEVAVGRALYLPEKMIQPEKVEYALCKFHLFTAQGSPKIWQVVGGDSFGK